MKTRILIQVLLGMLACGMLSGCGTTYADLNRSHQAAVFANEPISTARWTVDPSGFATARALEISTIGGDEVYAGGIGSGRARGDFYDVFAKNSEGLMYSLFGDPLKTHAGTRALSLRVTIEKVGMEIAYMAWSNASFSIDLKFELISARASEVVFSRIISTTATNKMGTLYSAHQRAHERANDAINKCFLEARAQIAARLAADTKSAP